MKHIAKFGSSLTLLATFVISVTHTNVLIALASCLVGLGSYLMLKTTTGEPFDPRRVTIPSFWYLTYLAMIYFPAFFVYADQEGAYRGRYLFAVEITLITVPLGCVLASIVAHSKKDEAERFFQQPLQEVYVSPRFSRAYSILFLAAILLTFLYMSEVSTIPLLYLLRHPADYLELVALREDSFKLLDSPFKYAYAIVRGVLYPFLMAVALGFFLQTRQKRWFWRFALTLTVGIFFAALSLAKEPVAAIFLVLMLFTYYYKRSAIGAKLVAGFLVLILLFPVAVIISLYQGSDAEVGIWTALVTIGSRLFYGPAEVVYYYYEVFPSHVGFLHGRSIGKLAWLLGLSYFDTPNYVGRYGWPYGLETINANGAFIADLNADFGLLGVVLGGILAGAIMQTMHIYLIRQRKTVLALSCYAFLVFTFWLLQSMSLPTVLASDGALLSLLLTWTLVKLTDPLQHLRTRAHSTETGSEQLA